MLWGGRWEGGSCLGTHVRIKDFKIKKKKNPPSLDAQVASLSFFPPSPNTKGTDTTVRSSRSKTPRSHHIRLAEQAGSPDQPCSPQSLFSSIRAEALGSQAGQRRVNTFLLPDRFHRLSLKQRAQNNEVVSNFQAPGGGRSSFQLRASLNVRANSTRRGRVLY